MELFACLLAGGPGGDVGDRKAVAGNEFVSFQLVIHAFQTPIDDRSLHLALFRELLKRP